MICYHLSMIYFDVAPVPVPEPARFVEPESQAILGVMTPDTVISGLLSRGRFKHDPDSVISTWPRKQGGWTHMLGETIEGDSVNPTSVTIYFPFRIQRILAQLRGKEPQARINLYVGNPVGPPDDRLTEERADVLRLSLQDADQAEV
jgi:hypothetical protein